MKSEAFRPGSQAFDEGWKGATAPVVTPAEFGQLIFEVLGEEVSPAIATKYVQVLGYYAELGEQWNMLDLKLLQLLDQPTKTLKHTVCGAFVDVAKDIALNPVSPQTIYSDVAVFRRFRRGRGTVKLQFLGFGVRTLERRHVVDRRLLETLEDNGLYMFEEVSMHDRREWPQLVEMLAWIDGLANSPLDVHPSSDLQSNVFMLLLHLQVRLSAELCPVLVHGQLDWDLVQILAGSTNFHLKVLQMVEGNMFTEVRQHLEEETQDLQPSQTIRQRRKKDVAGDRASLGAHSVVATQKAFDLGKRGSLILIVGLPAGSSVAGLCQRHKDMLLPNVVRFICLEEPGLNVLDECQVSQD